MVWFKVEYASKIKPKSVNGREDIHILILVFVGQKPTAILAVGKPTANAELVGTFRQSGD